MLFRSKKLYQDLYDWILTTDVPNKRAGMLLEWSWYFLWEVYPNMCSEQVQKKQVIQVSKYKQPVYVKTLIQNQCANWEYRNFIDQDIVEYMKKNPIDEFDKSVELFCSIPNGAHRADFFRYYILYLEGGVYVDSDLLLNRPIEEIIGDHSFVSVESGDRKSTRLNSSH